MNIKQYRYIKVNRQVIVKYLPRVRNRGKGKNKVISEDLSPCIFDIGYKEEVYGESEAKESSNGIRDVFFILDSISSICCNAS